MTTVPPPDNAPSGRASSQSPSGRTSPLPPSGRPPRGRSLALVVAAVLLASYAAAGFLLAPGLVHDAILANLGRTLAARVSLGRVRVNPFALSLTVDTLAIADRSGRAVAGFNRLYVRFDPLGSLLRRAPTLSELRLDRPALTVEILSDRTLNLARLLRPQPPQPTSADTTGEMPRFTIRHLAIAGGELRYGDRSRLPYFEKRLAPMRIELGDFGTPRESRNDYALDATTEAGEKLAWRGRFTLSPFHSAGTLHVGGVRAATLAGFMGPATPFVLTRGAFTLDARYRLDAARTPVEFTLAGIGVSAQDVALADRASGEEFVAARALETRDGALDLARSELSLGAVSVHAPRVLAWLGADGQLNFQRWAQAPAAGDTSRPLVTRIPSARIDGLAFVFEDRRLATPARLQLGAGAVTLADYSTAAGSRFHATFACSLGAGGQASGEGTIAPGAPSADLQVRLAGFELRTLQPWIGAFVRMDVTGGTADAKGRLQFNTAGAHGPLLRFAGAASSRGFASVDHKAGERLLAWDALELAGLEYDAMPGRMVLHEVRATKPFLRVIVAADRTTNLQALAVPPDSIPAAFRPAPGDTAVMPVRIDIVSISNGSLRFADLTLRPSFAIGVQGLDGSIRELSSAAAAHADVQLAGNVDAYAPARITGTLNPLNARGRTDLSVSFKNIELTTFTPYSAKFMGYRIQRGKLDLDLQYVIQDRRLDARNRVFMRQLTLGERVDSPDATHLPVRFAVALLKNKDGDIDLNLPVQGSLDDPKFSVMPIVVKVLLGLVTRAVASPFALLHAAFGGAGESSPAVTFPYGSAELDTADTATLVAVRKGLAEKPALRLEIEEAGDAERDSLALFARRYDETLRAARSLAPVPPASPAQLAAARALAPGRFAAGEYVELLTRAYTAQFGPPAAAPRARRPGPREAPPDSASVAGERARLALMDSRLRGAIHVDPALLGGLAHRRARRIQGILLADSTIAPERVFIVGNKGTYRPDSLGVKLGLTLTD